MRQFCKVECSNGVILHVNKFHFNTPLGAIKCNRNNKKKHYILAIHVFAKNDKQRKFFTVELLRLAFMYY